MKKMPIDAAFAVCGLVTPNALTAFQHDGMLNVANFAALADGDVIEMCKGMAARPITQHGYRIGALQSKRVRALASWARDLR